MSIQDYLADKIKIQESLLEFIHHEDSDKSLYQKLITYLDNPSIRKDRSELFTILKLIFEVFHNHHRHPQFQDKFGQLILFFKDDIKQTFSNAEIFKIFKKDKQILSYLISQNILTPDQSFVDAISNDYFKSRRYPAFFYPYIKSLLDEKLKSEIEPKVAAANKNGPDCFEKFQKIGENSLDYCELIRKDSLDKFVKYVADNKLPLSSAIEPSIFETNPFLINLVPTLIEYSAFYGSVNIFNYLLQNGIQPVPSVWLYAIHGEKIEILHTLEEKNVKPQDQTYKACFIEAVKCHHNEIADYIKSKYLDNKIDDLLLVWCIIKAHNFKYFPLDLNDYHKFYDLCEFNYVKLVSFLLHSIADINLNARVVLKTFFFIKFLVCVFNQVPFYFLITFQLNF